MSNGLVRRRCDRCSRDVVLVEPLGIVVEPYSEHWHTGAIGAVFIRGRGWRRSDSVHPEPGWHAPQHPCDYWRSRPSAPGLARVGELM